MRFSYLFFFIFICCNIALCQSGKVIKIKDGDTVVIIDSNNNQIVLRLAEVDCPEKSQAFGQKAKNFTAGQVALKVVNFKVIDTDRYGRSIAKIYYEGNKYLSEEIIKNGFGWHYKKFSKSYKLAQFEKKARAEKIGLWADSNALEPWLYRRKQQ